MKCLKCSKGGDFVFCGDCTPGYGETFYTTNRLHKNLTIFVGTIPFFKVISSHIRGNICIKWWMGTDALTMWYFPPGKSKVKIILHRIKMHLLEPFIEHWVTGERLLYDLPSRIKPIIKYWPGKYQAQVEKKAHEGFNILYYNPPNNIFNRWLYGLDIIQKIKQRVNGVNWIAVDGSQDMKEIYAITDLYIRPSRHDGAPRMNIECELNNIPVIYSLDGKVFSLLEHPDVEDMILKIDRFTMTTLQSGGA